MDEVTLRKKAHAVWRQAEQDAKKDCCLICNKKCSSFCNSRIIPQFVLKNISNNGMLLQGISSFEEKGILNDCEKGVAKTWTFKVICNECDQKYFSVYENETALLSIPTASIMASISLKNSMMQIAKRHTEISLYNLHEHRIDRKELLDEELELDLRDYLFDFKRALKIIDKKLKSGFTLVHYQVLDYIVPLALQGPVCIHRDLNGEIVNDVDNFDHNIRMQEMHFCIFPLKDKTVVILFHHKDDRNYIKFDKKFAKLTPDRKLQYINYLIFKYCEHYAISPKINSDVLQNENLIKLTKEHNDSPSHFFDLQSLFDQNATELVHWQSIPNLLSPDYKI